MSQFQQEKPSVGPLMLSIECLTLSDAEHQLLRRPSVGGLILFSRNYTDKAQLSALMSQIRAAKPGILVAVDQEGGRVQRFKSDFLRHPPPGVFEARYLESPEQALGDARLCGWAMAFELLEFGIDFSFAPVLDVFDPQSRVIGDRAFSAEPKLIEALGREYIAGMREAGMASTGKHFPGHGTVAGDSHVELPIDERSLNEIATKDLLPFAALAGELDAVMPAHVIYPQIDSRCAGFSSVWIQEILRGQLGFEGVVFSDDLTMDAAHSAGSIQTRCELAMSAGCDMVLVCNDNQAAALICDFLEANPGRHAVESQERLLRMRGKRPVADAVTAARSRYEKAASLLATLS